MPIPLRADFDARMVRAAARWSKNGPQARRLLALAAIYDGASRTEAAKIGGVTLQIVRDWVMKFNADGPEGHCHINRFTAHYLATRWTRIQEIQYLSESVSRGERAFSC
jgi:Homeodomain-like domain